MPLEEKLKQPCTAAMRRLSIPWFRGALIILALALAAGGLSVDAGPGFDTLVIRSPRAAELVERAAAAEDAAMAVPGITNSEGGEAGYGRSEIFLVTSAGFAGHRSPALPHNEVVAALAERGVLR